MIYIYIYSQCGRSNNPTIWGWFIQPIKTVIFGDGLVLGLPDYYQTGSSRPDWIFEVNHCP